jgi:crotonobetainyl-CoA:carnitine CoA-transferase CaiB-like acyl-CoA transferase
VDQEGETVQETTSRSPGDSLPLAGARVLDLGGLPSAYATRLPTMLGAEVVMVEPPGGSPIRREPPFAAPRYVSLAFAHFCLGRRSVCLDLGTNDGAELLLSLARGADVVVVDQTSPHQTAAGDLRTAAGALPTILADFRDVAPESPRAHFSGSNLVDEALGGLLALTGEAERPPTQLGGNQTWHLLSLHGLPAIVAAVFGRRAGTLAPDRPLHLVISAQEAAATATLQTANIHQYLWEGKVPRRAHAPAPAGQPAAAVVASSPPVPCRDGLAVIAVPMIFEWGKFLAWLDRSGVAVPEHLRDPRLHDWNARTAYRAEINAAIAEVARRYTAEEFSDSAQAHGLWAMPVQSPAMVAEDPDLRRRGIVFEHPLADDQGRTGYDVAPPFTANVPIARVEPSLPAIGADTAEIISGLPRYSATDVPLLLGCGAIRVA